MSASPPEIACFLDRLAPDDRDALEARLSRAVFEDGAVILAAGEEGADLFILFEGSAIAGLFSAQGREVTYRVAGPGDVVGELAAIDGVSRSATVTARGRVIAGRLGRPAMLDLLAERPGFALALLQHLTTAVRDVSERVFELSTMLVRERLMRELLRRARAVAGEEAEGEVALSPAPTHFELASRVGSNREAVSREMSRLASEGLVTRDGRTLVLRSAARLAEMLDDV